MKKISKRMKLTDIIDGICEMEAYIEYLEDILLNKWDPDLRKKTKAELKESRRRMTILNNMLSETQA